MEKLEVLYDSSEFEVPAEFDENHSITPECTQQMIESIRDYGFVIVPNLLSDEECDETLKIVKSVVDDPSRENANFASETDIGYRRRDFCPLPSNENILQFCSQITKRVGNVLTKYSDRNQMLLEISTLTSYQGSSHQYIHRDPPGVLSVFAALDDVSIEQGGTVFVPGTQPEGALERHGKNAMRLMEVFNLRCNMKVFGFNMRKLIRMKKHGNPKITKKEFWDRVFSTKQKDNHQPNIYHFLTSRNEEFRLSQFGPRSLIKRLLYGKKVLEMFHLVQVSPKKGTVVIYQSDMLHAGPDNKSDKPRYFLSLNIARMEMDEDRRRFGYSPHSSLLADPKTLGQLMDSQG